MEEKPEHRSLFGLRKMLWKSTFCAPWFIIFPPAEILLWIALPKSFIFLTTFLFLMIVFLWKISRQFYRLRLNLGWIGKTEARTWEKRVLIQTSDGRSPSFDHTIPGRQCFNSAILRAEKPASRKTQSCISNSLTFWHSWGTSDATLPYIFPGSPSLSQASRSTLSGLLSAP